MGAGVGGLAAAIRLRAAGHRVVVYERRAVVGGKLAVIDRDGFTFDVGPSLLTWPGVFDDVFQTGGTSLDEQLDLIRLDPQFHYRWPDGAELIVRDDPDDTADAFEAFAPGAGAQWRRFDERGRRIWEVAQRTFFAGPMDGPLQLARRMRTPFDLTAIDALRSLHRAASRTFDDERLMQWAGRYATYSGSSPFHAPATLACIAHLESSAGCWYPRGGLGALCAALERTAVGAGVEIHTSSEVAAIVTGPTRVTGVELSDGTVAPADAVLVNTDAEHLYRDLLPDPALLRRVRRASPSTSGFVVCAGVEAGRGGAVGHHNVWFSGDERREFDTIADGRLADDPTIYACVSSVTDETQAPPGYENWFLLVNTPPGVVVDRDGYRDLVLDRLAERGVDLSPGLRFTETMTPGDIADGYRSPGGAIYGTSSNGPRAAFLRPANRGSRDGLYLVGGSSHPGGGLPLVTTSARIVADMVEDDLR